MFRFLFVFLLIVHGLLHLLGFVHEWKLAAVLFSGKTLFPMTGGLSKIVGVLWLLTALIFIAATTIVFSKKENWWMVVAVGLLLSQFLIILYWPDAKFGTIANLVILAMTLPAFGNWKFEQKCQREIPAFLAKTTIEKQVLLPEQLTSLPPPVQRWLQRSGVVGQPIAQIVRLHQTGEMCMKPAGKWMPFEAEQLFTTPSPGFYWKVKANGGPLMQMTGRDQYLDGRGQMFIQLYSLFTVANASGPKTDQGALLRYLAEIMMFPAAATRDYIQWEEMDSLHARATMTWGGITASGIYQFDADGDAIGFEADRYYTGPHGEATLERWQIKMTAFCEFHGVRIPCRGEVTWKLKTGDFTWFKYEITDIEYSPGN